MNLLEKEKKATQLRKNQVRFRFGHFSAHCIAKRKKTIHDQCHKRESILTFFLFTNHCQSALFFSASLLFSSEWTHAQSTYTVPSENLCKIPLKGSLSETSTTKRVKHFSYLSECYMWLWEKRDVEQDSRSARPAADLQRHPILGAEERRRLVQEQKQWMVSRPWQCQSQSLQLQLQLMVVMMGCGGKCTVSSVPSWLPSYQEDSYQSGTYQNHRSAFPRSDCHTQSIPPCCCPDSSRAVQCVSSPPPSRSRHDWKSTQ